MCYNHDESYSILVLLRHFQRAPAAILDFVKQDTFLENFTMSFARERLSERDCGFIYALNMLYASNSMLDEFADVMALHAYVLFMTG